MDASSHNVLFKLMKNKAYFTHVPLNFKSVFLPNRLSYRGIISRNYFPTMFAYSQKFLFKLSGDKAYFTRLQLNFNSFLPPNHLSYHGLNSQNSFPTMASSSHRVLFNLIQERHTLFLLNWNLIPFFRQIIVNIIILFLEITSQLWLHLATKFHITWSKIRHTLLLSI
jgi:hypothetical protein